MNQIELSYQILMGEGRKLIADENLINTARWLEEQGIVDCVQEGCKIRVQLNLEGIDEWIKSELGKLTVEWKAYKQCVYGITLLEMEPEIVVRKEKTLLMSPFTCFWVQTSELPRTYGNQDIIVHFADIFCKKINFRKFVERIANNKDTTLALKWEKEALYLNEHLILTEQSTLQKGIMQILIDRQNCGKYISFEEIGDILQEQYHLEIDDVHNQVYKPIHILQTKVMKKVPQLAQRDGFIEICKSFCRLNSSVWVVD